jgi:hypothetical protein
MNTLHLSLRKYQHMSFECPALYDAENGGWGMGFSPLLDIQELDHKDSIHYEYVG